MGHASALKDSRRALRDATGIDFGKILNSHADSITDLVKALHHEVHMRVQHVQMIHDENEALKVRVTRLEERFAKMESPQ